MYQKFVHESVVLRRILCACLVLIMALSMLPMAAPRAAAAMDGQTLYIKPNGGIGDTAWYFAHFFNDGGGSTDVRMTENSDGNHYCTVPNGYAKVVIVRMNPDYSAPSWDGNGFWNKTNDLTLPTDGNNCYEATGWSGSIMTGNWTKIADTSTPTQPSTPSTNVTAYLAGSWTSWATNKIEMTGTDGKNASVTVELAVGRYEFKIIYDNTWYTNTGEISDATGSGGWDMYQNDKNCVLNASGGSYTFTFNIDTKKLVVTYSSSGSGGTGDSTGTVVDLNTGTFVKDPNKLYVNTTFYDYYSDYELDGNNLDSKYAFVKGDHWYIFDQFNQALSSYYSTNSAKVPIYAGHFQPEWEENGKKWGWPFAKHGQALYGYKDNQAWGVITQDQKYFMSVNNSNMNLTPELGYVNAAAWGIVADTLDGNDKLQAVKNNGTSKFIMPFFDEDFLLNGDKKLGDVYENVQFPFAKEDLHGDGIMYWVFDSEDTTLEMKKDTANDQYYLDDITAVRQNYGRFKNMNSDGQVQDKYGFFPFNEGSSSSNVNTYNYGFGTRLDIPFNLTYDGKLVDKYGEKQDIIFEFSGDDDVWVFIDGKLVLDIGGSHGKVEGEINFADKTATVSSVKTSGGNHTASGSDKTTSFTLTGNMTDEHTLTMFYMERGMWESNMSIAFNFVPREALMAPTTTMKVTKAWNVADGVTLPANIKVQLQRRLAEGEWENVGNAVSVTGTGNEWTYIFEGLDKFADEARTKAYEFRVFELDTDGSILEGGESNSSGMIVTYGDVFGNGATGYEQVITNHKLADSVVVIDFGLSVDITVDKAVTSSINGTLYGVGDPSKLPIGTSVTFKDSDLVTSGDYIGTHGKATIVNGKLRYTPTDMKMDKAELVGYALKYTSGGKDYYYYSTVTIIPAANIYYEDSFLSFTNSTVNHATYGKWSAATVQNGVQQEDRPGTGNDLPDNNNVYGYDPAYGNCDEYSFGATRKVTVNAETGAPTTAPKASFTFTGTGFDVVSVTDNKSGAVWVEVLNENKECEVSYIVNNYYGMKYENGKWVVVDNDAACLYQVPVIKVDGLDYGTYDVNIRASYLDFMDVEGKGYYTYYMDAIRIYNPAKNDPTSKDAYDKDGESNPYFTTIKKLILAANTFDNGNTTANGVVYIDGKSSNVTISDYEHEGPNNETYLLNGNGIAFKLKYTGSTKPTSSTLGLQIGAKLADGTSATMKINGTTVATLTTATNMFYKLPTITWTGSSGNYETNPIVITCSNVGDSILSLTDLKLTGSLADEVKAVSTGEPATASDDAEILAVFDMGVYDFAVKVMSSGTDVEEPTEPETTEPEVTEPETTEPEVTEPETTEPEVTEPEVTEPETTEPEVTEPEATEPETTEPETEESTAAPTQKPVKDPSNAQTGDLSGQSLPMFAMAAFVSLLAIIVMTAYTVKSRKIEV